MSRHRLVGCALAFLVLLATGASGSAQPVPVAGPVRTLDAQAGTAAGVSPDGTKIAMVTLGISVCMFDSATLDELSCASIADAGISVRADDMVWSPDSTRIAFAEMGFMLGTDSDLWTMDAATGALLNLTDDSFAGSIYALEDDDPATSAEFFVDVSPAWTPDGHYVSFARSGYVNGKPIGTVLARVLASGGTVEELFRLSELEPGVAHARSAWSPDGTSLYFSRTSAFLVDEEDGVWAYDAPTGTAAPVATYDGSNLGPPALLDVSPAGGSLLIWYPTAVRNFTLAETLIRLVDVDTGAIAPPRMPLIAPMAFRGMTQGTFSPDGSAMLLLVDGAKEDRNELWMLDFASEETTLLLEGVPDPIYDGWTALSWGANSTVVIGLQDGGAIVTEIAGAATNGT